MIERVTGILTEVDTGRVCVEVHGITYGILVSPHVAGELVQSGRVNSEVTFHTLYYIEGSAGIGNMLPRIVGFPDKTDLNFFMLLTSVQGFGMRKALRSLIIPVRDMAKAIELGDEAALKRLPEIGGKTAQKIIVELKGKTLEYTVLDESDMAAHGPAPTLEEEYQQDALEVLLQLQYTRDEAVRLIGEVSSANDAITSADVLIQEVLRRQGGGR